MAESSLSGFGGVMALLLMVGKSQNGGESCPEPCLRAGGPHSCKGASVCCRQVPHQATRQKWTASSGAENNRPTSAERGVALTFLVRLERKGLGMLVMSMLRVIALAHQVGPERAGHT